MSSGSGGVAAGSGGLAAGGSSGGVNNGGGSGGLPPGPCQPPADTKRPFEKLSETGCMDAASPTKMASFVIPYDVNSPLWSDNADKERGMVVPEGQKIHVRNCASNPDECQLGAQDDGQWVFPVGSVLIKNFSFDNKLVETRLFVRAAKTWVGYGYQWNEEQTEATVVPDEARTVMFNTGTRTVPWTYPSRYDCMLCHNRPGGSTLGPETKQLNRMMGGENLLDKLERLNLFDAPLPKPYSTPLPTPYPGQEGTPPAGATTEQLARSYLHANCAFCHRADGNADTLDLRWGVPIPELKACNQMPKKGNAGLTTATILTPGKPEESVMWARVSTLGDDRMPQLGTYVVDDPGVELISAWIASLQGCE